MTIECLTLLMASNFNPLNTAHFEPAPVPLLCASKIVACENSCPSLPSGVKMLLEPGARKDSCFSRLAK